LSIAKEIIKQKTVTLELIKGKDISGSSFFAYTLFPADVFEKFVKPKLGKEAISLAEYGIILHRAEGEKPDAATEKMVLKKFEEMQK